MILFQKRSDINIEIDSDTGNKEETLLDLGSEDGTESIFQD